MSIPADFIGFKRTKYGMEWCCEHIPGMTDETLQTIVDTSAKVAAREARASGKNYFIATSPFPAAATFVLAADHPRFAQNPALRVRYEITPAGKVIRHERKVQ